MVRGAQLLGHRLLEVFRIVRDVRTGSGQNYDFGRAKGFGRCATFNTLRGRRPRVLVGCYDKNAALSPVVCGDPNCRAQKEFARLGAKE